jgi:plasmid stabilization system protein ParE
MGWKIIFAPQALEELEQIVRFIAQDDSQAAIRFGDCLVDRAESLAIFQSLERHTGSARMFDGSCADRITSTIVLCARSS